MFFNKRDRNCEVLELEEVDKNERIIGHTASSIGNYIVFVGGILDGDDSLLESSPTYQSTRIFDLVGDEWVSIEIKNEEKVEKRYLHSSVVHDESVFTFGGKSKRFFHNDLFVLDVRNFEFSNLLGVIGDPPTPRYGHSSAANDNFMYVFGGYCRNGFTHNDLHSYEFKTKTWVRFKTEILPRRYFHSSVIFENEMYIINGKTKEGQPIGDFHKIDLTTLKSSPLKTKSSKKNRSIVATWGQKAFIYNKKIYCFGGMTVNKKRSKNKKKNQVLIKTLREYDFEKSTWLEVPLDENTKSIGCAFGSVTIWRSQKLVFFGGVRDSKNAQRTKFQILVDRLPDEIVREILKYCDAVILARLNSVSKTSPFAAISCEDQFWKYRVEEIQKHGIVKLGLTSDALVGKFHPKDYKLQIIDVVRGYFHFPKHHYGLVDYDEDIGDSDNYLRMLERSSHFIRMVVLGDDSSGKSQLIQRITSNCFLTEYIPGMMGSQSLTLNIPYSKLSSQEIKKQNKARKSRKRANRFDVKEFNFVELDFLETMGSEDYVRLRPFSYHQLKDIVSVVMICFSMVDRQTFENVRKWVSELQFFLPFTPMMLVGLQSDRIGSCEPGISVTEKEVEEMAHRYGFHFWNITSAKTGFGCTRSFYETMVICERLRRDETFMQKYDRKYRSVLLDESLIMENMFAKGEVNGYDASCNAEYAFKLNKRDVKILK